MQLLLFFGGIFSLFIGWKLFPICFAAVFSSHRRQWIEWKAPCSKYPTLSPKWSAGQEGPIVWSWRRRTLREGRYVRDFFNLDHLRKAMGEKAYVRGAFWAGRVVIMSGCLLSAPKLIHVLWAKARKEAQQRIFLLFTHVLIWTFLL